MEIYNLILDEYSNLLSNSEKVFILLLYRKMQKENVASICMNYEKIAEETFISKTTISRALRTAEELKLLKRETACVNRIKKTKITILRGM